MIDSAVIWTPPNSTYHSLLFLPQMHLHSYYCDSVHPTVVITPSESHACERCELWERQQQVSAENSTTTEVSFVTESCYLLTGILCDKIFHVHVERERFKERMTLT